MPKPLRTTILAVAVAASLVGLACRRAPAPTTRTAADLNVVCTFLPVYVFTLNVVRDIPGVRVEMIVSPDVGCPHHYALRPADLKRVARADLIVANGIGAEPFLDDLRKTNPGARLIIIADDCDVLHSDLDGHGSEDVDHAGHGHSEANAHVWVSPVEAAKEVRTLARKLAQADPARADRYKANGEEFVARLETLHGRMLDAAKGFAKRDIVTFHDAFAYLARDLGLSVVATLQAEPGQEPSAHRMGEVIDVVKKTRAPIFYEPASSDRVARAIARDAGVPVFPLNPFNSLDTDPAADSYEKVMLANLRTLQQALGGT